MKKIMALVLTVAFLTLFGIGLPQKASAEEYQMNLQAKSAILMDSETGAVLFEQNADEALPPASVTKIMTLLLVMEAIENGRIALSDHVTVSEEAAAMGGSQVYLEVGETMTVDEMIKCVVIASANDAAYALAEHVAGSEAAFVSRMNARAAELGMKNTHFENTNGLDDTAKEHLISARDIAIMSRALIRHEKILEYTTIWQDSVRNGAFTLTNTNRLVRFYPGATGLKTGSTSKALFCISATAKRDGTHLIAVVMGAPTRDIRNAEAKKLLDYGFASYTCYKTEGESLAPIPLLGSKSDMLPICVAPISVVLQKGQDSRIKVEYSLPESLSAPVTEGDVIGYAEYTVDGKTVAKADVVALASAEPIGFLELLWRLFCQTVGIASK